MNDFQPFQFYNSQSIIIFNSYTCISQNAIAFNKLAKSLSTFLRAVVIIIKYKLIQ